MRIILEGPVEGMIRHARDKWPGGFIGITLIAAQKPVMFFVRSHDRDAIVSNLFSTRARPFLPKRIKDDGHGHVTRDNYSLEISLNLNSSRHGARID